jgi:hypothetical protein
VDSDLLVSLQVRDWRGRLSGPHGAFDSRWPRPKAVHRGRNDLQAVTAMLRLQASAVTQPAAREALMDAEARVHALASLNTRLDAGAQGVDDLCHPVACCRAFLEFRSA